MLSLPSLSSEFTLDVFLFQVGLQMVFGWLMGDGQMNSGWEWIPLPGGALQMGVQGFGWLMGDG